MDNLGITEQDYLEMLEFSLGNPDPTHGNLNLLEYNSPTLIHKVEQFISSRLPHLKFFRLDLRGKASYSIMLNLKKEVPKEIWEAKPGEWLVHIIHADDHAFQLEEEELVPGDLYPNFNWEREALFRKLPFHSFLWVAPYFLKQMKLRSKDFMSWVTTIYRFHKDDISIPVGYIDFSMPPKSVPDRLKMDFEKSEGNSLLSNLNSLQYLSYEYEGLNRHKNAYFVLKRLDDLLIQEEKPREDLLHDIFRRSGNLLVKMGNYEDGLDAMKRAAVLKTDWVILSDMGIPLVELGKLEEAEKCLLQANRMNQFKETPRLDPVIINLAALYARKGMLPESIEMLREAFNLRKSFLPSIIITQSFYYLSLIFFVLRKFHEASFMIGQAVVSSEKAKKQFEFYFSRLFQTWINQKESISETDLLSTDLNSIQIESTDSSQIIGSAWAKIGVDLARFREWELALRAFEAATHHLLLPECSVQQLEYLDKTLDLTAKYTQRCNLSPSFSDRLSRISNLVRNYLTESIGNSES